MFNAPNTEILQIIEAISKEKGLPRDSLINALEDALCTAARRGYSQDCNIKVEINRKTGQVGLWQLCHVVPDAETNGDLNSIQLSQALSIDPDIEIGSECKKPLPPIDLGRVSAQRARVIMRDSIVKAEREREYKLFKDRVGGIITGVVKFVHSRGVVIEFSRTEGLIKQEEMMRGDSFRIGDKVRAYIYDVQSTLKGQQILLSRANDNFLLRLLEMEVPEIQENIIKIHSIARDPGSRSKIAVFSSDSHVDPIGACVGARGSRIKHLRSELNGEKIDLVSWDRNDVQFIVNALKPTQILKILIDEEQRSAEVVVADDQLSVAIGSRGQNARLVSRLTGWKIKILSHTQANAKEENNIQAMIEQYIQHLDIDEQISGILIKNGIHSVHELAMIELEDLEAIEEFDTAIARELRERACEYLENQQNVIMQELEALGVEQGLLELLEIDLDKILLLAREGIKSLIDLTTLDVKEFRGIVGDVGVSDEQIAIWLNTAQNCEQNN
ncbi:Transcription termination/antitermination protein NusA [Rickettsiales endosymbiont of Paramecium tredecaurelia]|uniref:transcription termination factor NusA n=1 Tax=Candidatus Sarmatiella mevalonica TaxID=2770581 RepID=UPI0019250846|nr:transcription termination factor NusA [Candidatus Sarmatiella mevalonica]MBL3285099.1 Transcription termination/antitermination protein NusA [Candidatus Sarmatiella mevalonica]